MGDVKIDVSGFDRLLSNEPDQLDTWLRGVGNAMVTDIQLSFGTSPGGRTYKRGKITHIASRPGHPPNVDIGTLRATIRLRRKAALHYEITDGVEHGILLEEGTQTIAPRPFMGPVFIRYRTEIEKRADDLDLTAGL
jgi:hypothetical protein